MFSRQLLRRSFVARRLFSSDNTPQFTLPDLPYDYGALEPVISADIMLLHHTKHHATYVANLNAAVGSYDLAKAEGDVSGMTEALSAIKFNGGGHVNHSIFWKNMCPPGSAFGEPQGELWSAIKKDFGHFVDFRESFNKHALGVQGSGWCWLVRNKFTLFSKQYFFPFLL